MDFTAHKMLPVTAFVAFLFFSNFYPACSRNVSFVTKRQAALGDGEGASPRVVSDGQWSRQCSHRVDDVLKAAAKEIARRRGAGGGEAQLSLPNKGGGVGGGHWEEWSVSGRQEAEGGRAKREARGGEWERSGRKSRRRARGRRKKEGSGKEAGWSVLQDVQERIRTEMLREEGEKRTKHRRIQNIFLETRGRGKDRGGAGKGAVSSGKTRRGGRKGYGGRKRSGREDAAASQRSGNETTAAWGARKRRLPRAVYEWPSGLSLLRPLRSAPGMDMTVQGLSFESFDAATTMGCNFARGEGEAPPALKVAVVFRRAIVTGRVGINGRLHPASDNRAAHGEEEKEKDRGNRRYMECDMSARVSDLTVIVTIHAERRRRLDGGGAGGNMGEWGPEPRGGEDKMEDSKEEEEDGEGWRRDEEEAGSREKDEGDDGTPKWRKKVEEGGKGWKGEEATKVGQESKEGVAKGGEWAGVEAKGVDGWKESQDKGNEEWSSQESLAEEGWKEEKPKIGEEWRREEVPPVSKMAPDPVGAFETVATVAKGKLEGREADKIGAYHRDEASSIKAPSNRVEPPEEGDEGTRESARVPRVAWGANPRGGQAGVGKRIGGVEAWRGEEDAAGEGLSWMEGGGRGRLGRRDGVAADEVRGVSGTRRVEKWEEGRRLGSGETLAEDAEKWEGIREGGGKTRVGWEGSGKGLGWGGEAEEAAASGVSGNSKAKEEHGDEWEPVIGSKAPGWEAERPEASGSEGGKLQGTRSEALREWGEPRGEDDRRERSWVGSKPGGVSRGGRKEARRGGSGPHGNPPSGYMEKWPVLIRGPGVPVEASGRGGGPTGVGAERRQWDEKPKAERRRERWPVFESRPPDKWAVNWVTGEKSQGSNPGRDHHGTHIGQEDHHGPPGARGVGAMEGRGRSQHPGSPMGTHRSPHPPRYPGRSEEGGPDHSRGSGFFSNHPTTGKRYRRSTHESMKYTEPDKNAQIKVWEELKKDPWWSGKHVYLKDAITRDSERKAFINLLTKMTEQERTSEALEGMEAIQILEIHPHEENITSGGQGGSKKAGLPILAKDDVKSSLAEKDEHPMNVANITWDNIQDSFGHKPGLGFSHLGGGNLTAFNGGVELGRSERRKRSGDQLSGLESLKHARSPILMKSDSFMVGLPLIRFSGCTDDFGWLKQSWESESQFHGHSHVRAPDPLRLKQEMEGLFYGGVKRMIGMFSERTVRGILAEDLATKLGFIVSYG